MAHVDTCEILIVGGGPAGAVLARLLALRGHVVAVAARAIDSRRGLAESLPPSTRKVMAAVGVLDAVERSGACRNVGNAVWWGRGAGRIEDFRTPGDATGLQIWRPDFDRLLADEAREAGAGWTAGNVTDVDFDDPSGDVLTRVLTPQGEKRIASRMVVDASGRSGALARPARQPLPGRRTHAWVGRWTCPAASALAGDTRTLVETTDHAWVWSVPVSTTERCVTVMVDPDRSSFAQNGSLHARYLGELARTQHIEPLLTGATFRHVWGCDGSMYETADLGGPRHLIVGDAASFIDPLSSFGVKKALTSAWMAAAVVHTALVDPDMAAAAHDLFETREREAYAASVRRSAEFARDALASHDTPFWQSRAGVDEDVAAAPAEPVDDADVAGAFEALRQKAAVQRRPGASVQFAWQPAFLGDRVGLERALVSDRLGRPVKFVDNVDLTRLVDLVDEGRPVGEVFAGYCAHEAPVPLPSFLRALSVLVAGRVLEPVDR